VVGLTPACTWDPEDEQVDPTGGLSLWPDMAKISPCPREILSELELFLPNSEPDVNSPMGKGANWAKLRNLLRSSVAFRLKGSGSGTLSAQSGAPVVLEGVTARRDRTEEHLAQYQDKLLGTLEAWQQLLTQDSFDPYEEETGWRRHHLLSSAALFAVRRLSCVDLPSVSCASRRVGEVGGRASAER